MTRRARYVDRRESPVGDVPKRRLRKWPLEKATEGSRIEPATIEKVSNENPKRPRLSGRPRADQSKPNIIVGLEDEAREGIAPASFATRFDRSSKAERLSSIGGKPHRPAQ